MSSFKWLNILLIMENFFGIYRNYCSQKKIKKYFIIIKIFVHTLLYTIFVIYKVCYLIFERDGYNQIKLIFLCFSISTYMECVSSVVTGICYSRAFMSYLRSISRASEYLKDDKKLINTLKKIFCFGIFFILFSFLFSTFRSVEAYIIFEPSNPLIILILMVVLQAIIRITVVLQHFMVYVIIMIVVHLTNCLTSLVSAAQERVARYDISSDEQCDITREQIQGWVELYRDLMNCCDKVTLSFGRQYFFSLIISITQYILVLYEIFYTYILNLGGHTDNGVRIVFVLFTIISVMIMPLVAGQMARNRGVKLHRALGGLYNTMIIIDSSEAEAKLIKDFIRLLKKNPLEIKLSSKVPAGMYMLPVILTLAVNYVIVMLQFNHVI